MRYATRRAGRNGLRDNNSFWLSFSDLMSALLLVFVLIMFYSVYQYFDMLEIKTKELLVQEGLLDTKEAELDEKDKALTESQTKLTESEQALITQQSKLLLQQNELSTLGDALDAQKSELDSAKALLTEQERELVAARALLDEQITTVNTQTQLLERQQEQLDEQQQRLDELVGVRARIIASLGEAFQQANVKATVDPTSGAITLDSSVLFESGKYALLPSGEREIDRFLPIYLNVLFADGNRENVSEIIIEGHTDSVGGYMTNLKLSQDRAFAVASYILSDGYNKISNDVKDQLRVIMTANGRSYSNLITDERGVEQRDDSRRVEFKFRLQDEQMIEDMRSLLDGMAE